MTFMEEELSKPNASETRQRPLRADGEPEQFSSIFAGAKPVEVAKRERQEYASRLEAEQLDTKREGLSPDNPIDLPELRTDSLYACITSKALRYRGMRQEYSVPAGFVGLAIADDGEESELLAGESIRGDFALHLFRTGTINLDTSLTGLRSQDGYDVDANVGYSLRLNDRSRDALKDFARESAQGRSHVSFPVLKHSFDHELRRSLAGWIGEQPVEVLVSSPDRDAAEARATADLAPLARQQSVAFLGLDTVTFTSKDLAKTREKRAQAERGNEESRHKLKLEEAIVQDQMGAELSRADLSEVLDAVRHQRRLSELEKEEERIKREHDVTRLQQEYRREKHDLEATLRRLSTENEIEIDRIRFEDYLRKTAEVRERLKEDRIEFYIQQIKDERVKAELLKRLIERDMSPEQLREVAEIERARSDRLRSLGISEDTLANPRSETPAESNLEGTTTPQSFAFPRLDESAVREVRAPAADSQRFPFPQSRGHPSQSESRSSAPVEMRQQATPTDAQGETLELHPSDFPESLESTPDHPKRQGELNAILIPAGRRIYRSNLDASGRVVDARVMFDLNEGTLGSLRSIKSEDLNGRKTLLVGARRGIYAIDVESRRVSSYPIEAAFNPLTGVNSMAAFQGKFYATHSQFGLLRWSIPGPMTPASHFLEDQTLSSQSVRSLFIDGGIWPTFACGRKLVAVEHRDVPTVAALYHGAPADILLVTSLGNRFYAACQDGHVVFWEKNRPAAPRVLVKLQNAISGATLSPDGRHFILADRSFALRIVNLETSVIARYDAPQEIFHGREFGRHVFGISTNRSTLYLWESFGNGQPVSQIPLPEPAYDVIGS